MSTAMTVYLSRLAQAVDNELAAHTWNVAMPGEDGYAQAIAQAFPFFRAAASGRYSSRTLMRLADLTDERPGKAMPVVLTVGSPFSYDEDTEVKRGGTLGMCVWWPEEDGRCLMAVTEGARRKKIGTTFLTFLQDYMSEWGNPSFWVGRTNAAAHHFLLDRELYPTAINSNGAVRYSGERPEDGQEETPRPTPERLVRRPRPAPPTSNQWFIDIDQAEEAMPTGYVEAGPW